MAEESDRRFGRRRVALSHLDKMLFPDAGIRKGELVDYYADIADVMLPHARNRPLTLRRFPDGIDAGGFVQQHRSEHFPAWIEGVKTRRADGDGPPVEHVLANDQATLAYLANQGVITFHGWLSRAPRLSTPDRLVFDLDPPDEDFAAVRRAARQVIDLMEELGLNPYLMTTGSRGLHVVAPLRAEAAFDAVRALALEELGDARLAPRRWHLKNIRRRLARRADPWQHIGRHATTLRTARRALDAIRDKGGGQR